MLALVGLVVAWNGYGYVQLERGWTLVISGTIGFCSGLILIALGLVLNALEAISASAAKSALFLAKARSVGAPAAEAAEPSRPTVLAQPEPVAEPEEAYEPDAFENVEEERPPFTGPGYAAPWEQAAHPAKAVEPEQDKGAAPRPPFWMTRTTSYVSTFGAAKVADAVEPKPEPEPEPEPARTPDAEDDWLEKAIAQEAFHEAEPKPEPELEAEHKAEPQPAPMADEWRDEREHSVFAEEAPAEIPPAQAISIEEELAESLRLEAARLAEEAEPAPSGESETREPSTLAQEPTALHETDHVYDVPVEHAPWLRAEIRPAPEPEPEPEPEPVAAVEPEPQPEPEPVKASESAPRSDIIGSYEAHGTHYTMYADGSIDAETAHGVYRFASMEELKRFIERS
ncbi:hypothetical protein [Rhodoblastus sp.]|uniref:hypothetical protein n=1 Tax=Rhodoblastus sp. TaxID=1962975 RepID=UPI0035AEF03C